MFKYTQRVGFGPSCLCYNRAFAQKVPSKYLLNENPEYLKFYNESKTELINELETSISNFDIKHEGRSDVIDRFPNILEKWGWQLLKSPFLNPMDDFIQLTKYKSNDNSICVDILLDYRIPENEGVREMQMLLTKENKGSLYFIGTLDKSIGFTSGSCISVPVGIRDEIINGEQATFNSLGAKFSKYMESDETELNELNWMVQESVKSNSMEDLEGVREKFDILLYDYMAMETGLIAYGEADFNSNLLNVIWLISVYSELEANRNWMLQLKDVIN